MRTKEKAARVLQHQDGSGQQIALEGFDELTTLDFSTIFTPAQGTIAALLPRDRAAALTTRELCNLTGQRPRDITRRICAERRNGAPILSDPAAGFWLAADAAELARCARALHKRAGEIHRTARALERIATGGGKHGNS
jgi:hypothetical protein